MAVPGVSLRTVNDLVQGVIDALQQRTDITGIAPRFLRKAILEVTESYPFEELRTVGPVTSLTAGLSTYPVSKFLNNGDDLTSVEVWTIFIDPPNDTIKQTLDYKTPKAIEMITSPVTAGIPAWWTRYGTNFRIAPTPLQAFDTFMSYQVRHPFTENPTDTQAILGQQLFFPASWDEIMEYAAAERIAHVKRWNDEVDRIHQILYGDPEYQVSEGKRGRPGIIAARIFQVERDQRFNTRSLGVRVGRYNAR